MPLTTPPVWSGCLGGRLVSKSEQDCSEVRMRLEELEKYVRHGELTLVESNGARHRFGVGTPRATWVMRKPGAIKRILANPALELGESYMDEGWDVEDATLAELLMILRNNFGD